MRKDCSFLQQNCQGWFSRQSPPLLLQNIDDTARSLCEGQNKSSKEWPMAEKAVGSVMVIGGGIAGMQSALDLADSGYFVHLVEKSPAIGGVMSELDKTFPTNDCAM